MHIHMWIFTAATQVQLHPEQNLFLEDIHDALLPLVQEGKIDAFDIGKTVRTDRYGPLRFIKKDSHKKENLVFAALHAMEWISTESAMELL